MLDILSVIPGKKRATSSGWYSFNAICCHYRGHKLDRRGRGGILLETNGWRYHCFNCQFKCGNRLGQHFSKNTKLLLTWSGVSEEQIERLSFDSWSHRSILDELNNGAETIAVEFKDRPLSASCQPVCRDNPEHSVHIEYLASRGLTLDSYTYYHDPLATRPGIIIPYYWNGRIVGHTTRFYDNRVPKYISDQAKGYVFNVDAQQSNWASVILTEGQFDAISIGGCAYMGSNISDEQARTIATLQRTVIVVPDRDVSGLSICNRALELGYNVAIPEWHRDIKDVNDAVKRYGRLATTLSILQSATTSKIKVDMLRRKLNDE